MPFNFLMGVASPLTGLVIIVLMAGWGRAFHKPDRKAEDEARIIRSGATSPDLGGTLLFLSMAYRPNHAFVAKAQIAEREEMDDGGQGGPDTPQRHLMRQLRGIRRGEPVDRLVWRLE